MTYNIQNRDGATALDINEAFDLLNGYGVLMSEGGGCEVTAATGMDVNVADGTVLIDASSTAVAATTVTIPTADADNPRKDIVYVDSAGAVQVAQGVAGPARPSNATGPHTYHPEPPDLSATEAVPLAEIWVAAGTSSIDSGDIRDRRTDSEVAFGSVRTGSTAHGQNPAETITDSSSPKDLSFTGSDDRDIHNRTEVTISNSSGGSATEDVTVTLYDGTDNTGTQLASETLSVSLADGGSTTETFITGDEPLDNGDYFIEVTQSGTALTIDSTTEFTKGAKHTISQSTVGELEVTNQDGVTEASIDPISGRSTFESVSTEVGDIGQQYSQTVIDVSADPYNAPTYGSGEDGTSVVQQAIDDLPADGGTLIFPHLVPVEGRLDVTDRLFIKFTNTAASHRGVDGAGDVQGGIYGVGGQTVLVDTLGSVGLSFDCVVGCEGSGGSGQPGVGILVGRSDSEAHPWGHNFDGLTMSGAFSQAGLYNTGKEVSSMNYAEISIDADSPALYHASDNPLGISSPYVTHNPVDSITKWSYINTRFLRGSGGFTSPVVEFRGNVQRHTFQNCYWNAGSGTYVMIDTDTSPTIIENPPNRNVFAASAVEGSGDEFLGKEGGGNIEGVDVENTRYNGGGTYCVDFRDGSGGLAKYVKIEDTHGESYIGDAMVEADVRLRAEGSFEATSALDDSHVVTVSDGATFTGPGASSMAGAIVNGSGRSAVSSGSSPSASNWDVGQIVEVLADNTVWIKTSDGTMTQL